MQPPIPQPETAPEPTVPAEPDPGEAGVVASDEERAHPWARRHEARLVGRMLNALRAPPGAMLLDAGCGPGVQAILAARAGYRVLGLDLSHAVLGEAERRVAMEGLADRITLRQADLTRLDLPDDSFQHIYAWRVLPHIPEAEAALDHLARVLAPGGRMVLHLTNAAGWEPSLRAKWGGGPPGERGALGWGGWVERGDAQGWLWRFDPEALGAFLGRRGLTLRRTILGEWTHAHRGAAGPARAAWLGVNRVGSWIGVPGRWGASMLMVLERTA